MMTWNYRIYDDGKGSLMLVEAFYDDKGRLKAWTDGMTGFGVGSDEGKKALVKSLKMALRDASEYPVFTDADLGKPGPPRRSKAPIKRKK